MRFFELSVASKYLSPRWRQLSVSIISLISFFVISLVVWLIVVFFSVTHGLEKNWVQKLIALTAPLRVVPTQEYYDSYYYQIDSLSSQADYSLKTIGEKWDSEITDPYDPNFDEEIPSDWRYPDLNEKGELKDITKLAYQAIHDVNGASPHDYEMTFGNIRLRLLRDMPRSYATNWYPNTMQNQSFLTQNAYIGSFDPSNEMLQKAMLPITSEDIDNLLNSISLASDNIQEDIPDDISRLDKHTTIKKLTSLMSTMKIRQLKTPKHGWTVSRILLPDNCTLEGCALIGNSSINKIIIPQNARELATIIQELETDGYKVSPVSIQLDKDIAKISVNGVEKPLPESIPLTIEGARQFGANLNFDSIRDASHASELTFSIDFPVQGVRLVGDTPLGDLEIASVDLQQNFQPDDQLSPSWFYQTKEKDGTQQNHLPADAELGESILLPKTFRDAGVLLGDRGYLSYLSPTASSIQEQRIPVAVSGFYDPGIMPIGGKLVLTSKEVTSFIRGSQGQDDNVMTNGINVRLDNLDNAEDVKAQLEQAFQDAGISQYWTIETYREYDFARDILQQLKSEKNLFSLLAIVILIVACSNIISMLIILVNDKKVEIGILRSMGASSLSIASIFGLCGIIMGLVGSITGIVLGLITLKNLNSIVALLSRLQGHEMFNPAFYGDTLPNEVSFESLGFVIIMTATISTIAGVVPAIKACMFRPSEILRSE
jgi:lipoprotein-releasing system permease protein